ncbi:MAG TPA: PP2C family protein-serine/threonine phosphatase [Acidimicrobiales bacterium]|nr:PP2C family protein-serine/threonine phosphatase [Acidimicrobiales bacterium]
MNSDPALRELSLASTFLHPDDLAATVVDIAARNGLEDFVIYLADIEQITLTALRSPGLAVVDALSIDESEGGHAYRSERPVVPDGPGAPDGAGRIWLPLLDSSERIGVTTCVVSDRSHETIAHCLAFSNLVGELVANKQAYGDVIIRTRRTREMTLAAEMRWSMLPPLTYSGHNVTITGLLEPAYRIAGDTFDYAINGDTVHLTVLDAVGHQLEAARIANLAVGSYRYCRRRDCTLLETYADMDATINSQFGVEKFCAAQLAQLTLSTGKLEWLNAGIPPAVLIRDGQGIDLVSEVALPAGLASMTPGAPSVAETTLEPGDLVLFATDGITEARDPDGTQFGRHRLVDFAQRTASTGGTGPEILRQLGHAVLAHQRGVLQDDATLVLLAWHGPPAGG